MYPSGWWSAEWGGGAVGGEKVDETDRQPSRARNLQGPFWHIAVHCIRNAQVAGCWGCIGDECAAPVAAGSGVRISLDHF